jgi:5-methylcytosine-specific restriction endonuclease McrA
MKLLKIKTARNKADKLLTPLIQKMYPNCLLCGSRTEVAHHHVHKSKSTALRYYLPNLIPLCHSCHLKLHQNESYWGSKVTLLMGKKWFDDLEHRKNEIVKADVHYYLAAHDRLKEKFDE